MCRGHVSAGMHIERAESEKDGYECIVSDDYPPHEVRHREAGR